MATKLAWSLLGGEQSALARAFLQSLPIPGSSTTHRNALILIVSLLSGCDPSCTLMPSRAFSTHGNVLLQVRGAARASVNCPAAARACLPPGERRF